MRSSRIHRSLTIFALAGGAAGGTAFAQVTGPSTQQTPQFVATMPAAGVEFYSIASNGNGASNPDESFPRLNGPAPYRLVGLPDGTGAFRTAQDIAEGTFTWLVNHEAGSAVGIVRDHGSRGAFVSLWRVRTDPGSANHLEVVGAQDLIQQVKLWNVNTNQYDTYNAGNPMPTYAGNVLGSGPDPNQNGFGRFCSADLADVSAFKFGKSGTDARIFLTGEENGASGRAFANIASGPEAGTTYELPRLGDYSWENAVACPFPQAKTVVIGLDDSTPGQVYVYIGTKQGTGTEVERAGLTNGTKFGIVVADVTVNAGQPVEDRVNGLGNAASGPVFTKPFTMFNLGDLTNVTGAQLQTLSDTNGVVNWLRPEDGAWDRVDQSKFYFVTTDSFTGNSRLWMLDFTDITQPELGGVVTMLLDGSIPGSAAGGWATGTGITDARMMDNICMTHNNQVLIQEDVGNNARLGRIWMYDAVADSMTEIAQADPARYLSGGAVFVTQDEESSGIIDAWDIIGPGWFLLDNQGHYSIPGELVEGGQLLAVYIPATIPAGFACYANCDGSTVAPVLNVNDFICFQQLYAAGSSRANCDNSTVAPVLNVNDFICFQQVFASGCR
jgi:hypothetical protein